MIHQSIIRILLQKGILSEIDIQFAKFITGFSANKDADVFLAAALVSHATATGNICLNLTSEAGKLVLDQEGQNDPLICPNLTVWQKKLAAHPAVGAPGERCPLIMDTQNRLYLYRYWDYEKTVSESIKIRVQKDVTGLNLKRLKESLKRLFPVTDGQGIDWQKIAAVIASLKNFSVITGGPGTGKTFTVTKVLALLAEQDPERPLRIYLVAPTGKAAARLKESVLVARGHINCSDSIKEIIPSEGYTIHRLLKPIKDSPYFRYNQENPLGADIVIVDEASMVDLALMAKFIQAIPIDARLILVGDKDQLASVESGSVLGDICDRHVMHGFSDSLVHKINELTGENMESLISQATEIPNLQDCIVVLPKSYRFVPNSGIGGLSRAVNRGDAAAVFAILSDAGEESIKWQKHQSANTLVKALSKQIVVGYREYLKRRDPASALEQLNRFKILCALNTGPYGVQALNRMAENVLFQEKLIQPHPTAENPWYAGRPILITRNDYNLGLFNGDIGIALPASTSGRNELYVFFPGDSGEVRRFQPYQLPQHETVYAMTVHKSQGSEFDEVLLILPDQDFSFLTREHLYTALTRAKLKLSIWGTQSILRGVIARKIERTSGLREALWGDDKWQKTEKLKGSIS
jgi:exodeoxyribonuclease V alpha subunit